MRLMGKLLIITHGQQEGTGTLGDFLESQGVRIRPVRLHEGDRLPGDPRRFDAIITMGGGMHVHEDNWYPFLRDEADFIERAVERNVPMLGICLGAQIITRVCHAAVNHSPEHTPGWSSVCVTEQGRKDILLQGIPEVMTVFHRCNGMFGIPQGASLLASINGSPNQAFRYRNAYGLQFHIELTRNMLMQWVKDMPQEQDILAEYDDIKIDYTRQAKIIYSNFLWFVELYHRSLAQRSGRSL